MKIILKEDDEALQMFEELINQVADSVVRRVEHRLKEISNDSKTNENMWVSVTEAKDILGIRSKKKMQQIRDQSPMNGIIISKHGRTFRYHKLSLLRYLDKGILK